MSSHVADNQHKITGKPLPSGLRADQILVEYFDLKTTVNTEVEKTINEYQDLSSKKEKSEEDKSRLKILEVKLKKYNYHLAETVKDRAVQKRLLEMLQNEGANND